MIDRDLLLATLDYNPLTGVFTWRTDRPQSHFKTYNAFRVYQGKYSGKVAGCVQSHGSVEYITIRIQGKLHLAHRLAWLFVHGDVPPLLDHEDGDGTNNKLANLHASDKINNGKNSKMKSNNTSGVTGVYWNKPNSNWVAEGHYTEDGVKRKKSLGSYTHLEDAKKARKVWEEVNNFSPRHGSPQTQSEK